MAEFSKQWSELNPDYGFGDADFDIDEIFNSLEPEYGIPLICEGFGFTYIAKKSDGECVLYFPENDKWVNYQEFLNNY